MKMPLAPTSLNTLVYFVADSSAPSAKLFLRHQTQDALVEPRKEALAGASTSPEVPLYHDRRNPLDELEAALAGWCRDKGLPFSQLVFKVDTRLAGIPPTPLPPQPLLTEYEDMLMEQLLQVQVTDVYDARSDPAADRTVLRSLYGRYRAVPNSLTDDQTALVYAALCTSRFAQIRVAISEGENLTLTDESREDITYYHKAYNALASWSRPSLVALCELVVKWKVKLTLRGALLPYPILYRHGRTCRVQGPSPADGMADQGAGPPPPRDSKPLSAARPGRRALLRLLLHRDVRLAPGWR